MSIKLKLTIIFLAVALIPTLLVVAISFQNYRNSLEAEHLTNLQHLIIYKADRIETFFSGLKTNIKVAQSFYVIKKNLPVLTRFASDPNNPEFIAARKVLDEQLQQVQLVSGISDIMLINPQGKVVYANKSKHWSKDLSNGIDAEQKAVSEGKNNVYVSDIYFDKTEDNRFEMLITAPASDLNGAFSGVIAFEVDMSAVYNLIQDTTGLGHTGEVLAVRKIGNHVEFLNPLRHDQQAALSRKASFGDVAAYPAQQAALGKTGAGIATDYRGEKTIAAWRYIPSLDWGLVAKIDAAEAFTDVTNLQKLVMIVLVLIFILAGLMAFSIARSIAGPINKLAIDAEIIGSGNLDLKVATDSKDEIGQLSRSFDKMTHDLRTTTASRDELNREIIERKHAEEALRDSEERFRTMANAMQQLAWIARADGHIFWYNQRWYDYTGTTAEQMEGWGWQSVHDQVLLPKVMEQWKVSLDQGTPFEMEFPLRRADGQFRQFLTRGVPLKDTKGRVVQWFGTNTDVNDIKQAEMALRESKQDLSRAQEVAHVGSWRLDVRQDILTWSEEAYRIFGIPAGITLTYEKFLDAVHPDDRDYLDSKWKAALQGEKYDIEHRIIVDGKIKWVREKAELEADKDGTLIGGFGTVQDITARKQADEALRKSEEQLRMAANAARIGMWSWIPGTSHVNVSANWRQLFGVDDTTPVTFETWRDALHPDDRERAVSELNAASNQHREFNVEYRVVHPDGTIRWIIDRGQASYNEQGQPIAMAGVNVDNTERKLAENEIKRNEARLESLMRISQHQTNSIQELLDFALNEAINLTGSKIGYIYHYDETKKEFTLNTWSKNVMEQCAITEQQTVYQLEKTGLWGEAVRQAKPIVVNDFHAPNPLKKGYPVGHNPLLKFMTIPVFSNGHIVGVVGVANKETDYDNSDVQQLTVLMDSVWKITDRKKAEEALAISEGRYRRLFEAARDGILILDADSGQIVDVNPFIKEMLGYSHDELLNKKLWEIGTFKNILASKESFLELQTKGFVRYEGLPLETKDGRRISVEFVSNVYMVDHMKVIQCNIRDITERVQAQEQVRRSAQRLGILSETASQLLQSKEPQKTVNTLCRKVMEHLDCHIFINYLVDEEIHRLHLNASGGLPDQTAKTIEWLDFGQAICGRVAQEGKRIVAENIQESCDTRADLVRSFGIRAYACHPIIAQNRVIGTLSFGTKSRTTYSEEDLALMKTVTDEVATAMERMQYQESLRELNEELEQRVHERTEQLTHTVEILQEEVMQRQAAEENIRKQASLLDLAHDAIIVRDLDARVVFWSDGARENYGFTKEQALGKTVHVILKTQFPIPLEKIEADVVNKGKWEGELTHTRSDGRQITVASRWALQRDADGKPSAMMEINTDITESKRMQDELRESSLYSRSLLEASLDPLVTISPEGKITDVNMATEVSTGADREALIGSDFSSYFTDPQKADEGYRKVLSEGFITDYPLTVRNVAGTTMDVLYNATVYKNQAGQIQGVFAAARDVTERKAAEQKQAVTNSLLSLFAKKTLRKAYLDDTVSVIRNWSDCEFIGIRIRDDKGNIPYESNADFDRNFLALEGTLNLEEDHCICIRTMLQQPLAGEKSFTTPGGSFYCNDSHAFLHSLPKEEIANYRGNCMKWGFQSIAVIPIRYRNEILGVVHVADPRKGMVDPSKVQFIESTICPLIGEAVQRFNAEEELEKYRLHLEELVAKRTAELEKEVIHRKQVADDLTRSNKDLEQFAYVASHDLQEPLRAVAGFVGLLKHQLGDSLDSKKLEYMSFVVDGVMRMQTLINGLLEYSRIGSRGRKPEPTDFKAALDRVMAHLQVSIQETGAQVTAENLPTIHVDALQIVQLFQNLIGNAIKFRGPEAPRIHISASHEDNKWKFAVADNGIGIDQQYADRIFLIFQRLHTRDKYPGTGIGLSLCKKIVERHHGKIWVESKPGAGSTFYFTISDMGKTS